jgi:hypothetical protein
MVIFLLSITMKFLLKHQNYLVMPNRINYRISLMDPIT